MNSSTNSYHRSEIRDCLESISLVSPVNALLDQSSKNHSIPSSCTSISEYFKFLQSLKSVNLESEVVITFSVHNPNSDVEEQIIEILGSQSLNELSQYIFCINDTIDICEVHSAYNDFESVGYMCFEDTIYIDEKHFSKPTNKELDWNDISVPPVLRDIKEWMLTNLRINKSVFEQKRLLFQKQLIDNSHESTQNSRSVPIVDDSRGSTRPNGTSNSRNSDVFDNIGVHNSNALNYGSSLSRSSNTDTPISQVKPTLHRTSNPAVDTFVDNIYSAVALDDWSSAISIASSKSKLMKRRSKKTESMLSDDNTSHGSSRINRTNISSKAFQTNLIPNRSAVLESNDDTGNLKTSSTHIDSIHKENLNQILFKIRQKSLVNSFIDSSNNEGKCISAGDTIYLKGMSSSYCNNITGKLGQKYLYCHHGCCEHVIRIKSIRHHQQIQQHQNDINQPDTINSNKKRRIGEVDYPIVLHQNIFHSRKCDVCETWACNYVTYEDRLAETNPAYFCK